MKNEQSSSIIDFVIINSNAEVAELADAADSKSAGLNTRVGSTPTFGTNKIKGFRVLYILEKNKKQPH